VFCFSVALCVCVCVCVCACFQLPAAPLIMGNDLRSVPPSHAAILLNKDAIAVDQVWERLGLHRGLLGF
jgi:hypothetical protein